MSERLDSYLTQWVRDLAVGHTLTEADRKVLDRVVLALQNADKHHAQARAAQAILAALREPSDAILIAIGQADGLYGDVSDQRLVAMLRAAVEAATLEATT